MTNQEQEFRVELVRRASEPKSEGWVEVDRNETHVLWRHPTGRTSLARFTHWRELAPPQPHGIVNRALASGNLARALCEICGAARVHAHHDDYAKPLEVRWLCAVHHKSWHSENGPGANAGDSK